MNKTTNVDRIKNTFIALVLPTKSVLNIKNHAVHNIHRLIIMGPYTRGPPGNYPACPCVKTALIKT
jgi:hypothetical protein